MSCDNNSLNARDFEGSEQGIEEHDLLDLTKELTDAGKYSYVGLCAVSLHALFDTDWDQLFCQKCLKCILKHMELPDTVEPIMQLLLSGEMVNTVESFTDILKTEEALDGNLTYLLQDLIAVAVQEGEYDARWRVLIRYIATIIGAQFEEVELYEITVIHCLTRDHRILSEAEKKAMKSRARLVKAKRYAMIGLATIGGGALIGVTGGLAAPLIGSGLASMVGGSALFTALGYGAGAAVLGTFFGAAGAGLAGYKMNKRVGEIEEFAFGQLCPYTENGRDGLTMVTTPQLDISIALSGWIKDESEDNFTRPWKTLCSSREQYYLRYESAYLLELGRAMEYMMTIALSMATQEALKFTILSGLVNAVAWPAGLLGLASVIDNPWGVCCRRSAQVGKHLAEVLINREHGRRPVTLIGYSLGARAIFYCLREMSERENCTGVIQDAYLIGAPCTGNPVKWDKICKVVAGTITNAYCKTDWLLRFLYRTLSMPRGGVAGLQPIDINNKRLKNVDLSHIVSGHGDYPEKMQEILKELGVRVVEHHQDRDELAVTRSHEHLAVPTDSKTTPMNKSQSDTLLVKNDKK
ncbi:transmembrane and coiled-coil domain-containing protein 4-like isoform X2 [Rhodnius prolixus]|uniref:transmembrane and coiled-coil domain-containing protein 4-like isoform X2 n=1 Tax=Rhodnius prolixus TaxID=13249 RepID=UPI003D18B049